MTQHYDFYITVDSAAFRQARAASGLSLQAVGSSVGLSATRVGDFENGRYPATKISKASELARILRVEIDVIFPGATERSAAITAASAPTKARKHDFIVNAVPGNITQIRKKRGISLKELCASAGVTQPAIFFIESGKNKTVKNTTAEAIAKALDVDVVTLFPEYNERSAEFIAKHRQKLSEEERDALAVEMIPYVWQLAYYHAGSLPRWDREEAYSFFLLVLAECLDSFDTKGTAAFKTYLTAAIKKRVDSEQRKQYTKMRSAQECSLDEVIYAGRSRGHEQSLGDIVSSGYDLEAHVEAREELRYRLRNTDAETRRIVSRELGL